MPLKPRTLVTILSTIYLLSLTSLAAYALHKSNHLTLPVPNILGALAIALPPLAGLALETTTSLVKATNQTTPTSNPLSLTPNRPAKITASRANLILNLTIAFLLIYETVLATLAGTHLRPSNCRLQETWQGMFRGKDAEGIRAIQDALACCGLRSAADMAWPFPGAGRSGRECEARFDDGVVPRCLDGWRGEEKAVGGMLVGVAVGVFVWKVLLLIVPTSGSHSWLPSGIQLPGDTDRHRQIEYHDAEEAGEEDSLADEVRRLNSDSELASAVEGTRERGSVLLPHENGWAASSVAV
ncbi:hypothetical protein Q7P37_003312 [Cladosporium fusiforme]